MRVSPFLLLVAFLTAAPLVASEPGQPLDCSDMVTNLPGISCVHLDPHPCSGICTVGGTTMEVVDNDGHRLVANNHAAPFGAEEDCDGALIPLAGFHIWRADPVQQVVIAEIGDRCGSSQTADRVQVLGISFHEEAGRIFLRMKSTCDSQFGSGSCNYPDTYWMAALEGFTTTFEILQSYAPTTSSLRFRVPYMPEGLQSADHFDTYHGDLATVGDWSKAQPLQCGYPASLPSAGDHLTVPDPLPDPEPGHGRYYVTAVTHQGQTRYGRNRSGGVLSGRDPALLPVCVDE